MKAPHGGCCGAWGRTVLRGSAPGGGTGLFEAEEAGEDVVVGEVARTPVVAPPRASSSPACEDGSAGLALVPAIAQDRSYPEERGSRRENAIIRDGSREPLIERGATLTVRRVLLPLFTQARESLARSFPALKHIVDFAGAR